MSPHSWLPALLAGAAIASSAQAEPLTFDQALQRAQASAPSLKARALEIDAARAASRSAGARPDPRLMLGLDNFPVSGPVAGRLDGDEMTMAKIGLSQDMPSGAERQAQRVTAGAEIGVAQAALSIEARRVRLSTALAWIDVYYADRRLAALDEILKTLEPIWTAQPAAVAAGAARPAVALTPVRMRAALEDQRDELVAAQGRARAELARWTGDPSPQTFGAPPTPELDVVALRAGLDRHPSLTAYRAAADRAEAEVGLAQAAKRPDWSWEASYGHRDPMFGDMVSAGVSVRLPLFADKRQDPQIAARRADVSRVAVEREDARRALAAQFDADIADHLMHHAQWIRAEQVLAPAARQQSDLETASYAAGRAGLAEVVEAFGEVADARLLVLEREAAVARDAVRLVLTYGSDQ